MKEKSTSSVKIKMPKIQSSSFGDEGMKEDRRVGHDEHAVSSSSAAATRPPNSRPDVVPMLNLETTPGMRGLDKYKKKKMRMRKDHALGSQTERPARRRNVAMNVEKISDVWGDQGGLIHNLQRQRLVNLKERTMTFVDDQRAALSMEKIDVLENPPDMEESITMGMDVASPDQRFGSHTEFRPASQHLPRVPTGMLGSQTERLTREKPARGISTILYDTTARRRFLRETEKTLSKEGALSRFLVEPLPASKNKKAQSAQVLDPEQIEESVDLLRHETKRISKLLHMINASIRVTGGHSSMHADKIEERQHEMMEARRDVQRLSDTTRRVTDSLGQDKEDKVHARYDFVRANKEMLGLSDPRFKAARAIRQSVLKMEQMEQAVLRTGAVEMERCSNIGSVLVNRQKRALQQRKESDPRFIRRCKTAALWLNAAAISHSVRGFLLPVLFWRAKRLAMCILIQRLWRGFWVRKQMAQMHAVKGIRGRIPAVIERARARLVNRSADIVGWFLQALVETLGVTKAVRQFLKRVRFCQRHVRDFLARSKAIRARMVAQFDRLEKVLQLKLIREKSIQQAHDREKGKKKDNHQPGEHMDWTKFNHELHRVMVTENVKTEMCHCLLKAKRVKFVMKKQSWKQEIKLYRGSLHQTLLFRKEVAEILEGTELEHMSNNIESLAKNNKGLKAMMKNMNKQLPVKPEWREGVSDDKMKDLIRQCQFMCSHSNFSLRLLLQNHPQANPVVQPPAWLVAECDQPEMQLASVASMRRGSFGAQSFVSRPSLRAER